MNCEEQIRGLRCRVEEEMAVISELAVVLEGSAGDMRRHDQAAVVYNLRDRVMSEVGAIRRIEAVAACGRAGTAIAVGLGSLAIGGLVSAVSGNSAPKRIGAQVSRDILSKKVPFGSVEIAIGKQGIPEGVKVISVSRLARESGRSEPEVRATLRKDGYGVMVPEAFTRSLDTLERKILGGSVSLPAPIQELHRMGRSGTLQARLQVTPVTVRLVRGSKQ
ncbi:MAG: hypothetical protein HQ578_03315 [Chloroflexi bacterium]|nr:hypothetical protein [Chloroflexota bacterium]